MSNNNSKKTVAPLYRMDPVLKVLGATTNSGLPISLDQILRHGRFPVPTKGVKRLSDAVRETFRALLDLDWDRKGTVWYTWGVLAAGRDCTTTTIANHLNDLEAVGLLTRDVRHQDQVGGTRYWLELPPIKEIWRAVWIHRSLINREAGLEWMDKFERAFSLGPILTRDEIEDNFERFWAQSGERETAKWVHYFGHSIRSAEGRRQYIEARRHVFGFLNQGLPNEERTPVRHLLRQLDREETEE